MISWKSWFQDLDLRGWRDDRWELALCVSFFCKGPGEQFFLFFFRMERFFWGAEFRMYHYLSPTQKIKESYHDSQKMIPALSLWRLPLNLCHLAATRFTVPFGQRILKEPPGAGAGSWFSSSPKGLFKVKLLIERDSDSVIFNINHRWHLVI